ncbi:MAG: 3'-5' exonuclease, partial [Patescibacteria group bacterium]
LENMKDPEMRVENIQELIGLSQKYNGREKPIGIEEMLQDIALFVESEVRARQKKEGVQMMTLHSAKGLEFPVVFITGLEEGIFPHSRSTLDPAALEEERRLLYVGITRAKLRVYLLYAGQRTLFGSTQANTPSRFLHEISPALVKRHESHNSEDDIIDEW